VKKIPFNDLRTPYLELKTEIDQAVARVLDSGWYILGSEVQAFEEEFAAYCGAAGCVSVNSGTDALQLALRACGVGLGDEVITVSHTAVATVAAITLTGATPVLVDIEPATYTMSPAALEQAITPRTKAIVPVHIYGHPAQMDAILAIARQAKIRVIEDCAQAHGARYQGQRVGTLGDLGCFSFYPTKNLGALGDGGAVVGKDQELLEQVRLLREYGWTPENRYVSQVAGLNSRLDELQAAILRVKLGYLDQWNDARRTLAAHYAEHLPAEITQPQERANCHHVYHLYVVRMTERDAVWAALQGAGIGTNIHYPVPIHQQPAYLSGEVVVHDMSEAEQVVGEILSLPLYPQMALERVEQVTGVLNGQMKINQSNKLMELAGKINAFRNIEGPVLYQQQMRDEWEAT